MGEKVLLLDPGVVAGIREGKNCGSWIRDKHPGSAHNGIGRK
jgi:hypothetical protein